MFNLISKYYYQLQIQGLILVNPCRLFDRINQLEWYKRTHRQWFDEINLKTNTRVLEIGSATGTLTNYIAETGSIPIGLDSSSKMIKLARKNHPAISFIQASALELAFKKETFDAVIAASLLNIIPDKDLLLKEIFRATNQGGKISVLVPSKNFGDSDLLRLQQTESVSGFSAAAMKAWHNKPPKMSAEEITVILTQAGFTKIKSKYYLQGMVISVTAVKPILNHS
ncbi:MAG: class I SAM-dependent methyltransferase [Enterobacterales bacterium]|nr:class I SAM-dependent methyltransferase [Enterobacterales bacterium]